MKTLTHKTLALVVAPVFFLTLAPPLQGQSNEVLDAILQEEPLTYGSAAYVLLLALGELEEGASLTNAVAALNRLGHGLADRPGHAPLTLGEFSHLAMGLFGISGGVWYRFLPGPRYATRELAYRGALQGRAYPSMHLSGERALRIIGRILTLRERGLL
ncbi:hypothetical protein AU468_04840 [Alkalispirochaeta sphaeroplastigenens]|uniref:Uncharacterized protein n=1 Tax=Alkalispirochaeta sphaeroplastigenens TaxID=1187066 RepID=A0A2S4JWY2_9SPIO|nr:hypothetical protein [Alkalispirochaeta sphaeroplastigenens]POR03993.1 hypothetical protein AU468_04840 [Alkalispirochaeta sphaeroplastigenens]